MNDAHPTSETMLTRLKRNLAGHCGAVLTEHELRVLVGCAEALPDVIRISDRKHDAWDRAKAVLANLEGL